MPIMYPNPYLNDSIFPYYDSARGYGVFFKHQIVPNLVHTYPKVDPCIIWLQDTLNDTHDYEMYHYKKRARFIDRVNARFYIAVGGLEIPFMTHQTQYPIIWLTDHGHINIGCPLLSNFKWVTINHPNKLDMNYKCHV